MNNSITIEDFNKICRVCLISKNNIKFLSPMIIYMLEACTLVQEISNKKLPQQICFDCCGQLKNAFHFKEQYLTSIRILSEIVLQSENRVEKENNLETIEIKTEYKPDDNSDIKQEIFKETITVNDYNVKEETETEDAINSLNAESNNSVGSDCEKLSSKRINTDTDSASDSPNDEIFREIEKKMKRRLITQKSAAKGKYSKIVTCEKCGKILKLQHLRRHLQSHSEHRPYECDICPAKFKQLLTLNRHKIVVHDMGQVHKELCFICGKLLNHSLIIHLRTHKPLNENEQFKCDQCDRTYSLESSLKSHIYGKHRAYGTQEYPCEICNKVYVGKGSIKGHMLAMHSNSKQEHICEYCNRSFKRKSRLNVHIRITHKDERPHSCTMCEKKFHTRAILTNHMRTHTGERPFSCDICHKTFSFDAALRTHRKVHKK